MKKLALFDFDGTLFDTAKANYTAYNEAMKEFGYSFEYEYFKDYCNGRKYTEFLPNLIENDEIIEKVHKKKKEIYPTCIDKIEINKSLFDIIRGIKNDYNIVIVTTASKKSTIDILNHFGVYELFDDIIAQEDITKTKPDPEGFLIAMKKYSTKKDDTIIFEDSNVGIEAALKTGAKVYKIVQF